MDVDQWAAIGLVLATLATGIFTWLPSRDPTVAELKDANELLNSLTSSKLVEGPLLRARVLAVLRKRHFPGRAGLLLAKAIFFLLLGAVILLYGHEHGPLFHSPDSRLSIDTERKVWYLILAANPLMLGWRSLTTLASYDRWFDTRIRISLALQEEKEYEAYLGTAPQPKKLKLEEHLQRIANQLQADAAPLRAYAQKRKWVRYLFTAISVALFGVAFAIFWTHF